MFLVVCFDIKGVSWSAILCYCPFSFFIFPIFLVKGQYKSWHFLIHYNNCCKINDDAREKILCIYVLFPLTFKKWAIKNLALLSKYLIWLHYTKKGFILFCANKTKSSVLRSILLNLQTSNKNAIYSVPRSLYLLKDS